MKSSWKGSFLDFKFFNFLKKNEIKFDSKWLVNANTRSSTFVKQLLYKDLLIHTGQAFIQKQLSRRYIGLKLGQFVKTKERAVHNKKNKQKKKLRAARKALRRIKKHK